VENTDYINENTMDDEMMTEINNENNLTIALNQKNTPIIGAYEVNYFKTYFTEQKPLIQFFFIKTCF